MLENGCGDILGNPEIDEKWKHRVCPQNIGFSLNMLFLSVFVGEGIYIYIYIIFICLSMSHMFALGLQ